MALTFAAGPSAQAGSPDLSAGTEGAPSTVTAAQQAALQERLAAAERERDAAKAQAARYAPSLRIQMAVHASATVRCGRSRKTLRSACM